MPQLVFRTRNPTSGELLESYPTLPEAALDRAVELTATAFADWHRRPLDERTSVLVAIADQLDRQAEDLAELMAVEMGKPKLQGRAEIEKCAWVCRFYAEGSKSMLQTVQIPTDGSDSWVRYDPLGPILAIMPWNFPFWQVFRFLAPALAIGNTMLLKPAPSTPRCALATIRLLQQANLPRGVVQALFLDHDQVARAIRDPSIRGVTFTGSTSAGRRVASLAGAALKPMVAELGGSDPFIIFSDAELDLAIELGVFSRCLNSGQSCIAAKRFLVAADVFDDVAAGFKARLELETVGDPLDESTTVGPLARRDLRDTLVDQVEQRESLGAQVVLGGRPLPGNGYFFPPTLLLDRRGAVQDDQELFGPVATLQPFVDDDQALALANRTAYGLGASIFTTSQRRIERLVPQVEAGSVFVNGMVKSDPRLPFGGIKDSGFGRELGREGLLAFANTKAVWVR